MKLSVMRLAHRTPGIRALSAKVPPFWFFRWSEASTAISLTLSPHRKKSTRSIRKVLAEHCEPAAIERVAKRYAVYRQWLNQLEFGWQNWAARYAREGKIEGENHLRDALDRGRGVMLLSGHYLGFSRFVAPFLAEKGYPVTRVGSGVDPARREQRWGGRYFRKWQYIHYNGDLWNRTKALQRLRQALARNEIVHMSILWLPQGPSSLQFNVFSARLFLDPRMFQITADFACPRLPCIALCDTAGGISLQIEAPLSGAIDRAMQGFKERYRHWLQTWPEFMREWNRIDSSCDG